MVRIGPRKILFDLVVISYWGTIPSRGLKTLNGYLRMLFPILILFLNLFSLYLSTMLNNVN